MAIQPDVETNILRGDYSQTDSNSWVVMSQEGVTCNRGEDQRFSNDTLEVLSKWVSEYNIANEQYIRLCDSLLKSCNFIPYTYSNMKIFTVFLLQAILVVAYDPALYRRGPGKKDAGSSRSNFQFPSGRNAAQGHSGATGQSGGAQGQSGGAQGQSGGAQGQSGGAQGQSGGAQGQSGGAQGQSGAQGTKRGRSPSPNRSTQPSGNQPPGNQHEALPDWAQRYAGVQLAPGEPIMKLYKHPPPPGGRQ